jgi:hypothetical protein
MKALTLVEMEVKNMLDQLQKFFTQLEIFNTFKPIYAANSITR